MRNYQRDYSQDDFNRNNNRRGRNRSYSQGRGREGFDYDPYDQMSQPEDQYSEYRNEDYSSPSYRNQGQSFGSERGGYGQSSYESEDYGSPSRQMNYYGGYYNQGSSGQGYNRGQSQSRSQSQSQFQGRGRYGQESNYGQHYGQAPKNYQRSDERIREEICDELTQMGDFDKSDIEVKVSNGEVTLSGTVSERFAKRRIEDICDDISGVQDVHNNIKVSKSSDTTSSSDTSSQGSKRKLSSV